MIVIPKRPSEEALRELSYELKLLTAKDRNAFIYVYDDVRAAKDRDLALSDQLPLQRMRHHDRHLVAIYFRNINSGIHRYTIFPEGVGGNAIEIRF